MVPISHIHTSDITIPANTIDMKFGEIDKYQPSLEINSNDNNKSLMSMTLHAHGTSYYKLFLPVTLVL
jgi:hypothetical protein